MTGVFRQVGNVRIELTPQELAELNAERAHHTAENVRVMQGKRDAEAAKRDELEALIRRIVREEIA